MDSHFHEFSGPTPYSDRFAATSRRIVSSNKATRKLEILLKQEHPNFSDVWPQIDALPPAERNFLAAVFIAWAYEREFYKAAATGLLPAELLLCQDSGSDDGDYFYTYEFSPLRTREMFMAERLDFAQRDVRDFSAQVQHLNAVLAKGEDVRPITPPEPRIYVNGEALNGDALF